MYACDNSLLFIFNDIDKIVVALKALILFWKITIGCSDSMPGYKKATLLMIIEIFEN